MSTKKQFVMIPNWAAISAAANAVALSLNEPCFWEDGRIFTTERVCKVLGAVDFITTPSGEKGALWPHNWFIDEALTKEQFSQKVNG